MKQTQGDKHTIAWFKIADCVSRGEKERALGVYRLLSHSFNDPAVARQLEADIYLSFGEQELAIQLYAQAMELYQKSQRYLEAVAICEHLIIMNSVDIALRREAIKLHNMLGTISRIHEHIKKVLDLLMLISEDHHVQEFLSLLHGYSNELYDYAVTYIKEK